MKNEEKYLLAHQVREQIKAGRDISETVAHLKRFGWVASTIRVYYRAFATEGDGDDRRNT